MTSQDNQITNEKRRFTRIPFKVNVTLEVEGNTYKTQEIENLSIGGCLLPFHSNIEPGTKCQLTIWLSEKDSDMNVYVEGEIIRSIPGKTAVKFILIEPESLFHLHNIILHNAPNAEMIEEEIEKHPGLL